MRALLPLVRALADTAADPTLAPAREAQLRALGLQLWLSWSKCSF